MNLPELIKASGHDWNTPFAEIVKRESFVSELYKMDLQKEIEEAPDRQAFLESKIEVFNAFFNKGEAVDFFKRMADLQGLLSIGFNLQRETPKVKFSDIIASTGFRNKVFEFGQSNRKVIELCKINEEFKERLQSKNVSVLDIDEMNFEAFHYVVIGGNFAMVYKFLRDYLKNKATKPPAKKNNPIHAYEWVSVVSNLNILYKELKRSTICKETKYNDFAKIFSGDELLSNNSPVKWDSYNATEVIYLILQLRELKHLKEVKREDYVKMKRCFVQPDGKPFKSDFRSLKAEIDIKSGEKTKEKIDKILEKLTASK